MSIAIRLTAVSKTFGSFTANSAISLDVKEGTIHAIVGENGAGKSTLSNIIYGIHQPTSGEVAIAGKTVHFSSPRDAIKAGIGMVHQHFMLIPELSVAENIILGHEEAGIFGRLPLESAISRIRQEAKNYGLTVNPEARVASLSIGEQQRAEILKLLFRSAAIMIFDEPTAVLTPSERDQLFATLRALRKEGKTVILISHKLDEVLEIADAISVMRKGKIVGTVPAESVTKPELAEMMVGRSVLLKANNPNPSPGERLLNISNLSYRTVNGEARVHNLNIEICAGEIYGIAGVEGNGQSELLRILWGVAPAGNSISGDITIRGQSIIGKSPREIALMGISHIPEDRLRHAVITDYTVSENLVFGRHREPAFHKNIGFSNPAINRYTGKMIADYDIRCSVPAMQPLSALSGGNQQKVVLARELNRPGISLLILAQPTRGVDIGAIETIHRKIIEARQRGIAILLISSELEEIIALSTRIGCIYNGSIRHEFSHEEVMLKREAEHEFQREIGLYIT